MIDKAQEKKGLKDTKVRGSVLSAESAKANKFQDGDRSTRLYTAISMQLRCFSKIATNFYQEDLYSFQ